MSNNPYNSESNQNYGGTMPGSGSHQPQNNQRPSEGVGGGSTNTHDNMMRPNPENSFGMGQQNTSSSYNNNYLGQNQSNFGQNQIPSSQGNQNYNNGHANNNLGSQPQAMGSHMLGQSNPPQNQPSIGQRNYPSYPQPSYSGSQQIRQDMGQNLGGMNSGSMPQNYMGNSSGGISNMPPVGMASAPGTFKTSQGEATYEPGVPGQASSTGAGNPLHKDMPVSPEVLREFEEKASRCKQYKQTDVFAAILLKNEDDSLKVIDHLRKKGVSLTAKDILEQTALFYASRDGKVKVLSLLLEAGCDPNEKDQYGQTAIYYASRENHLEIAQKLIDAGTDINNTDMHQQTCLFYAANQGNIDMCAKLLDSGANINHIDNKRQTALSLAMKSKKSETVDYLISRGASITNRKNDRKRTPKVKKPSNDRKEPKKYVLTTFVNGNWIPLTDEDFQRLEKECPEVAQIIKDPSKLEDVKIPDVPEDVPIYDHWEKAGKRIINNLWKQESAWLFHYPVDVKAWKIEDYYTIVKDPMDFNTIKGKLSNNEYKSVDEFVLDVYKVFDNCILYNGESNQYSQVAKKMRKEFDSQYNSLAMDFYKK